MNNSMLPFLDGLAGLTRAVLDNASQRSWVEVEDLERQQSPQEGRPRRDAPRATSGSPASHGQDHAFRSSETVRPPASARPAATVADVPQTEVGHATYDVEVFAHSAGPQGDDAPGETPVVDPETGQISRQLASAASFPAGSGRPDAGAAAQFTAAEVSAMRAEMPASLLDVETSVASVHAEARRTTTGLPQGGSIAHGPSMPGLPDVSGSPPRAVVAVSTAQIDAAVSSIAHSLDTAGPLVAAQKLHEVLRPLSPQQAAAFLDISHVLVARIFAETRESMGAQSGTEAAEPRMEDSQKLQSLRTALALAHLVAAIETDPRSPATMRVVRDISGVVVSSPLQNDNVVFSGLAQAIGVGAGAKLALTIARDLADREENEKRARAFIKLVLSGLERLGERIDEAHAAVIRHLGPLLMEWAAWRGLPERDAVDALIAFVNRNPSLLDDLDPRLDRLEQAGLEAFRAIRDLSELAFDTELRRVHRQFVSSQSVLTSIAASRAALRELRHVASDADGVQTLEATRLTLTDIGFNAPRAAFLVNCSRIGGATMLDATWTALESFERMETQGRSFQRLLAFLNGQHVITTLPEIVSFDDEDMQF